MITTLGELTEWEQPTTLDTRSESVRDASDRVDEAVADVERDWQAVADCYEGDQEAALLAGFDDARTLTEELARTAASMDRIMGDFTGTLTTLRNRRSDCERDIDTFNAVYGHVPLGELEPAILDRYEQLRTRPAALQAEYESAVRTCVGGLDGLGSPGGLFSRKGMAALNEWNGVAGQTAWSLAVGLAGGIRSFHVKHRSSGSMRRRAGVRHVTFLDLNVTRALGRVGLTGPFLAALGRTGGNIATALPRGAATAFATMRHGGWRTAPWTGLRALGATGVEALRARGGVTAPLQAFQKSWKDTRGLAPTPGVRTAMIARGLMEGSLDRLSEAQATRVRQGRGRWRARFGSMFVDGIPLVGDAKHFMDSRALDHKSGKVSVRESKTTRNLARGARGLGAAGNLLSAGLTFADERDKAVEEVRASGEFVGDEAGAAREANIKAGAQTAGNVGSSILASAAVGAAAGSAVPVAGTAVGLVAGIATGVFMNVGITDTDGDGQKDSLAEMAGDKVEGFVNWVRGK